MQKFSKILVLIIFVFMAKNVYGEENPYFWVLKAGTSQHTQNDLLIAKHQGYGYSLNFTPYELLNSKLAIGLHFSVNGWDYYDIDRTETDLASITSIGLIPAIRYMKNTNLSNIKVFMKLGVGANFTGVRKYRNKHYDEPAPFIHSRAVRALKGHFQPEIELGYGLIYSISEYVAFEIEPEYHLIWIDNEAPYSNFHFWCLKLGFSYIRNQGSAKIL